MNPSSYRKALESVRFSKEEDGLSDIEKIRQLPVLGVGRHRSTHLTPSGKFVVKVPLSGDGEWANVVEANDYQKDRGLGRDRLARCRLIYPNGVPCLLMEKSRACGSGRRVTGVG